MRTVKNLEIIHNSDYSKFPDGTILNETEFNEGTPVVEEIYGDILTNFYAYLKDRKINVNNIQDSQTTGYQIIQALQKNVSQVSDKVHLLQKIGPTLFGLNIDFSLLFNKMYLVVRTNDKSISKNGIIRDSQDIERNFFVNRNFNQSDLLLLEIDSNSINGLVLNCCNQFLKVIDEKLIDYNSDKEDLWYIDKDFVYNSEIFLKLPFLHYNILSSYKKNDIFIFFIFDSEVQEYSFFIHKNNQLIKMSVVNAVISFKEEILLHCYFSENKAYISHGGYDDAGYSFLIFNIDSLLNTLNYEQKISINSDFEVSKNTIVNVNGFFSLIGQSLISYTFNSEVNKIKDIGFNFGQLFNVENDIFVSKNLNLIKL